MVRSVRRATIKDIAAQLGVSHSTVSRALRSDPRISSATSENVRKAARAAGYRPNIMALGLVHNRSSLIGILTSNVKGSFFADVIDGAQAVLDRRGYSSLLCCSNKSATAERAHLETLIDKRVEGIIVLPVTSCGTNSQVMRHAQNLHIPIVMVGTPKRHVDAPTVGCDNDRGGYMATRHVIEHGHERVVYLTHSCQDLQSRRHRYGLENALRYEGYSRALRDAGLEKEIRAVAMDEEDQERQPLRDLLSEKDAPTALFAYSDGLAISAVQAAQCWGYSIPRDVSVVGFDDIDFAARMYPSLTTVGQPKTEFGRYAAKKILNLIEGVPEDNLICAPELQVRDSTGPVPR